MIPKLKVPWVIWSSEGEITPTEFNQHKNNFFSCVSIDNKDVYCINKWMKIKISQLSFIIFLKTIKYICYTVFVTSRHIYLKISMEPSPK